MATDATKVLVGTPDQTTTGAVSSAPLGTTLPTDAGATLDPAFESTGFVSDEGVTISPEWSTTDIFDWSASAVRTLLEKFTGEITWTYIQTGYEELCHIFGADHVVKTDATKAAGTKLKVSLGAHLAPYKSHVFRMKDGDARMMIVVPNGRIIPNGDMTFVSNQPISWSARLVCSPDANGESIYIYTDDGQVVSA